MPFPTSKTDEFASKARIVHGDLYGYDAFHYVHSKIKQSSGYSLVVMWEREFKRNRY